MNDIYYPSFFNGKNIIIYEEKKKGEKVCKRVLEVHNQNPNIYTRQRHTKPEKRNKQKITPARKTRGTLKNNELRNTSITKKIDFS
jgi:hypothetical protein